jgi:hypothetical protein
MRGDAAMHDAPCPNLHKEEHVESSKPGGHHGQEIAGDDGLGVIADKRLPVLRRGPQAAIAIKAMAAKLARLVYRMLRCGMKYVDQGAAFYEAQHRKLQINYLKSKTDKLGFQIVQAPAA